MDSKNVTANTHNTRNSTESHDPTHSLATSSHDIADNLAHLKRHLLGGAQAHPKPSVPEQARKHNHFNIAQKKKAGGASRPSSSQTLKMSFTNTANETFVVTRTFSKPINALAAFKSAKIAEKSYGKLDSFALFNNPSPYPG